MTGGSRDRSTGMSCLAPTVRCMRRRSRCGTRRRAPRLLGWRIVKKLILLAVLALGLAAVWRKIQADRAELDLWTEATTADE